MTIKVKHILLVLLTIIAVIIIYRFFKEPAKELFRKKKYEKQIVNNYNLNLFDNVTDGTIEEYNYYKNYNNEPDIDISPLIESYIKQIEANEKSGSKLNGKYRVKLTSNMRREIECLDFTDTTNVFYGTDRKLDITELEKILVHKSKSKYSDWYLPKDSQKIIDLPYNYYLEYEPSDFKLLNNVKKVTKCIFPNKLETELNNGRNDIIIEYINNDGIKQIYNSLIILFDDSKHELGMFYSGLYYTETHNAKIILKNHYDDMIFKEIEERGYYDDPGWIWKWDKKDCKEIVEKIKKGK